MKLLRPSILAAAMSFAVACENPTDSDRKPEPAPVLAAPTALQGGYYARLGVVNLWWVAVVPQGTHEYRIEKKKDGAWAQYHMRRTESGSSWTDAYPGPHGTTQEYRVLLCNGTACSAPSNSVSVAIP